MTKKEYIETQYGELIKSDTEYNYEINIFNSKLYINEITNFYNTIKKYEEILDIIKSENETLESTWVKDNKIWLTINTNSFDQVYDTNLLGYIRKYNARKRFEETVYQNNHFLLSKYIRANTKVLIDFNCGHHPNWIVPNSYLQGVRCPICAQNITVPYVNDVYTKYPELLPYYVNVLDAVGASLAGKKQKFKCLNCGTIKETLPSVILTYGFSCPKCGEGNSYSERFMANILEQLQVNYQTHVYFDWCKFDIEDKKYQGVYDFVIEEKKMIIEMDGSQHYHADNSFQQGNFEKAKIKDQNKDFLAAKYGYNVYRINCDYPKNKTRFDYIKNNIIQTCNCIIDFSRIDWEEIKKYLCGSKIIEACNLWNQGYSVGYITKKLVTNKNTVNEYLEKGNSLNMCNYSITESQKRMGKFIASKHFKYAKVTQNNNIIGVFWDNYIFMEEYLKKYPHSTITRRKVVDRLNPNSPCKRIDGLLFQEITKEEYITLLKEPNIITDKGAGISSIFLS